MGFVNINELENGGEQIAFVKSVELVSFYMHISFPKHTFKNIQKILTQDYKLVHSFDQAQCYKQLEAFGLEFVMLVFSGLPDT